MRLSDKIAIVSGGGSGFGSGIVRKFAKEGAKVIVADIKIENAKKVARAAGGVAVEVDVSNSLSFKNLISTTLKKFGKIVEIIETKYKNGKELKEELDKIIQRRKGELYQ